MRIVVFAVIASDVSVVIESVVFVVIESVVFVVIESVASESVVFIVSESVTSESVARGGFAGGQESTPAVGRDSPEKQQVVASNQNVFLSNTKMYLSQITNCISFKSQNVFVSIFCWRREIDTYIGERFSREATNYLLTEVQVKIQSTIAS